MYAWCNLASLLLGVAAWALPLWACARGGYPGAPRRTLRCVAGSGAACALSLLLQLVYTAHLTVVGDWAALADTSYAVAGAAAILVAVTLSLNALAVLALRRSGPRP